MVKTAKIKIPIPKIPTRLMICLFFLKKALIFIPIENDYY
jgi:hypothetical protein